MLNYKAVRRNKLRRAVCSNVDKSLKHTVEQKERKEERRLVGCVQYDLIITKVNMQNETSYCFAGVVPFYPVFLVF